MERGAFHLPFLSSSHPPPEVDKWQLRALLAVHVSAIDLIGEVTRALEACAPLTPGLLLPIAEQRRLERERAISVRRRGRCLT